MKRVLLRGYYGYQNSGDDALLAASAWGVRQAYGTRISIAALATTIPVFPGSDRVRAAAPRVAWVRGHRRVHRMWEALRCDAMTFGGGSVFHGAAGLNEVETLLRLAGPGPHLAAGVSLGPFRAVHEERVCARILRRLAFVALRDEESAAMARALAPNVESRLTFDLAPLLTVLEGAPAPAKRRHGIGIALCDYERFTKGDVRREAVRRARFGQLLKSLDGETVEELMLIDFNGHPAAGDTRLHLEVAAMARAIGIRARHIAYNANPLAVLQAVSRLRAMLAMRLHAAVFGYLVQTPTIILSYHPKCLGWARQAGLAASSVHDSVEFDPRTVAESLARASRGELPAPSLPVAAAVERAQLNFPNLT